MSKIFSSASKLVFVLIAISACVGLYTGKLTAENFMVLATGAFAFYFTKTTPSSNQ